MYDDDVQPVVSLGSVSKYTKVAKFPTRNIKTPIVLVYGGSDSLVDINVMLKELPSHTIATEVPHYEHLDFLWAREVDTLVFPHVFDALESFSDAEHSKEEYDRYRSARHASIGASLARPTLPPPTYMSEDDGSQTYADIASVAPRNGADALASNTIKESPSAGFPSQNARKGVRRNEYDDSSADTSPVTPTHVRTIRIDEVNGNGKPSERMKGARSGSIGSNLNFEGNDGKGSRGISLGAGRAVSGVVMGETVGNITTSSDDGGGSEGKKRNKR